MDQRGAEQTVQVDKVAGAHSWLGCCEPVGDGLGGGFQRLSQSVAPSLWYKLHWFEPLDWV